MRAGLAALALALSLLARPALADDPNRDDPNRFKILLGGGYQFGTATFEEAASYALYQEAAAIDTAYSAGSAPGLDLGAQFNALKHVGFAAALTIYSRDLEGADNASFPHPFFYNQPRLAAGTVSGKQKETAGHVNVVVLGRKGHVDLSTWAGVSFFKVECDLVQNVLYDQIYPYDSVTVTSTPIARVSDSPVGFNVGAGADWRFARHVGAGAQARYAHAKAKLGVPNATPVEVDAGGFHLGLGIRFFF
jgi:opacity protein-like surface antigen